MVRTRSLIPIAAAVIMLATGAVADPIPFRVTGIVDTGRSRIAMIDEGNGKTRVIRPGDELAGGKVADITADGIRLVTAGGERVVRLAGLAAPSEGETPTSLAQGLSNTRRSDLLRRVQEARKTAARPTKPEGASPAAALRSAGTQPVKQDAQNTVNHVLGLPASFRVTDINAAPVRSDSDGLGVLEAALAGEGGINLRVNGPSGAEEIYFHPVDPPLPQ